MSGLANFTRRPLKVSGKSSPDAKWKKRRDLSNNNQIRPSLCTETLTTRQKSPSLNTKPESSKFRLLCASLSQMLKPRDIQLIGHEVAILWEDGSESYFPMEFLRERSPSAENQGETDVLGNRYGGDGPKKFPGVTVTGWHLVGGYAIRFQFSDGHQTGLYSFQYLRELKAT